MGLRLRRGMMMDGQVRRSMRLPNGHEKVAGGARRPLPYGLTARELAVLQLIAEGKRNREIGAQLSIRGTTVSKHVARMLKKMRATSRTELAARALREHLVD